MSMEGIDQSRLKEAGAITIAGGVSNGVLAAVKIGLGAFTGYLPLTASGFHSLSDIVSDTITWFALRLGSRRADRRFHYGYRRVETLMSLFAAFFLVFVSVELITDAFGGHGHGHGEPIAMVEGPAERGADVHAAKDHAQDRHAGDAQGGADGKILIGAVALLSMLVKETFFRITRRKGIRLNSPMLIAKAWHHRADSVSSAAVLLSLLISSYFPELTLVDRVTTIVISGMILHSAWEVGSTAVKELIDFAPSLKTMALIEEMAEKVAGVTFTHGARIRTMGGALYVELTVETDPDRTVAEGYAITEQIRKGVMAQVPNVVDVSTMVAPKGEYLRRFMATET